MKLKISKKLERLCRAMAMAHLYHINFPTDRCHERVDESWPGYLPEARDLNLFMLLIQDWQLKGEYTEADMEKWGKNHEI